MTDGPSGARGERWSVYTSAALSSAYIEGVQERGVGAVVRHLVCNDQEFERHTISVDIDERPLRELYLVPFEAAVAAGPWWAPITGCGARIARGEVSEADVSRGAARVVDPVERARKPAEDQPAVESASTVARAAAVDHKNCRSAPPRGTFG
jgi:hypothetical protein